MQHERILRFSAAVSLFLLGISCGTRVAAEESKIVNWAQVADVVDELPSVEAAEHRVDAARGVLRSARQYPNPEVELEVGAALGRQTEERRMVLGLGAGVPIVSPGLRSAQKKEAKAGIDAAESDMEETRLQTRMFLKRLYLRVAFLQARKELLDEALEAADRLVEVARLRVEHGEARPFEVDRLAIERSRVATSVFEAGTLLRADKKALGYAVGRDWGDDYEVAFDWQSAQTLPSLVQAIDAALGKNPRIARSDADKRRTEAFVDVERGRVFPEMKVGGFWDRELDADSFGGGFTMELPIWNWNRGEIARAQAERAEAEAALEGEKIGLKLEVLETHARVLAAQNAVQVHREEMLEKARNTASATEIMYRAGEIGVVELVDARRALLSVQESLLVALQGYHEALLELRGLMGEME